MRRVASLIVKITIFEKVQINRRIRMNTQAKYSNSSGLKNKFLNDLASSALLWKAKAFVVAKLVPASTMRACLQL